MRAAALVAFLLLVQLTMCSATQGSAAAADLVEYRGVDYKLQRGERAKVERFYGGEGVVKETWNDIDRGWEDFKANLRGEGNLYDTGSQGGWEGGHVVEGDEVRHARAWWFFI